MSAQPMFEPEDDEAGEHWLSVGDMMAGLMVISYSSHSPTCIT